MSFDTIRLSPSAIADLYRQSLVVLDDVQEIPPKTKPLPTAPAAIKTAVSAQPENATLPVPKPVIRYTGSFQKKISIVINNPIQAEMPAAEMEMLQKLMTACKLVPDDFAIINTAFNQPAAQELWQLMPASVMLLFSVDYGQVGIPFTRAYFQVEQWNNAWLMSAPPLSAFLGPDTLELKALKRELWNGLQKIFLGK